MPEDVVYYVSTYGYLAIFIMVFLQEIGLPNPFPNELLLVFSGYLTFKGLLYFPLVILTVVAADFTGTNILYFLFYTTGNLILRKKPKWFPVSEKMIERLTSKISKGGRMNIYLFRLTPFTRGYTSVITGLLRIRPGIFLPIALISGITWALVYVLAGYLIGPSWNLFSQNIDNFKYVMLSILAIVICLVILVYFTRKVTEQKEKSSVDNS